MWSVAFVNGCAFIPRNLKSRMSRLLPIRRLNYALMFQPRNHGQKQNSISRSFPSMDAMSEMMNSIILRRSSLLSFFASCRNCGFSKRNYCALAGICMRMAHASRHFLLDKSDELLHLPVHLFHAFPHLQDDGHSRDVHSQIPGEREDEFQPLQIFFGVQTGVALCARGFQQSFTLIQPQRLRMNRSEEH